MYKAIFYTDVHGHTPVKDLIDSLNQSSITNKQCNVKFKTISRYIDYLKFWGTRSRSEITEHIQGKIWQLRPGDVRILLFHWKDDKFVLLHSFDKKTGQTPQREIKRAIKEMNDWISRYGN